MKKIVFLFLGGFVVGTAAQVPSADYTLDVQAELRSPADQGRPFMPRSTDELIFSPHRPASTTQRLSLRLLPVEQATSKWGDPLTYSVFIQNIGSEATVLPWSPDTQSFMQSDRRVPRGYRRAVITLEVQDSARRVLGHLESESLYGSEEVPGSLLTLAPGKTALVRIPGRWAAVDEQRKDIAEALSKGPVFLVATLSIPQAGQLHVRSTNRLSFISQK